MIDEQRIQDALDGAFEVAEQLEAILLSVRSENRRADVRKRVEEHVVEAAVENATGTPVEVQTLGRHNPPPNGEVWLTDLADELGISDSQFYVWQRQGRIEMNKRGQRNILPQSDAWKLREIVAKRPARFKTNARWIGAWFRGERE